MESVPGDGSQVLQLGRVMRDVQRWQRDTFRETATVSGALAHLRKELDEVEEACQLGLDAWPEVADVFILWCQVASQVGMGPAGAAYAVEEKLETNRQRKWKAPDADGVVEHE